jgi:ABC-type amino acid transport substrate-binding protein
MIDTTTKNRIETRRNEGNEGHGEGKNTPSIFSVISVPPCFNSVLFLLICAFLVAAPAHAQDPAPTLVPPTLVPQPNVEIFDALPSESGIAQIVRTNKVRVGILFNETPFGVLDIRGNVSGFDADLARAFGTAWGVEVEFVQVTRQTAIDLLVSGSVEMLLAALPHTRELDTRVEFSQTYYPTDQAMMVREGDGAAALADMANRRVGVVLGTRAEQAAAYWQARGGITVTVQPYLTLDQAIGALAANEVDGVIDNRIRLTRTITQPGVVRLLDGAVMPEPYAVAVRRQDANLRALVNRTLQYFEANGTLNEIHRANFNGAAYPAANFVRWANVGDEAPQPSQFGEDIPFPTQYVIPQMQADGILRVAGARDLPPEAPESERRLDTANRAVIEAMAGRWGVRVEYVAGDDTLGLVAGGAADLALGVSADWNAAAQVDFTSVYLQRGELIMVQAGSAIGGFGDLRGRVVGVFNDEPGAAERVTALAEAQRVIIRSTFSILREQDAAFGMLVDLNYNAVFGDSLRLLPLLQEQPDALALLTDADGNPQFFSRQYLSLAVPRNDIDFRLLVEYTLQEMALDGGLATALANVTVPGGLVTVDVWPGERTYLGYRLGG